MHFPRILTLISYASLTMGHVTWKTCPNPAWYLDEDIMPPDSDLNVRDTDKHDPQNDDPPAHISHTNHLKTQKLQIIANGETSSHAKAAIKKAAAAGTVEADLSLCTHLHIGKFGWCAGCRRLEKCIGVGFFVIGGLLAWIAACVLTGGASLTTIAAFTSFLGSIGFSVSTFNDCIIGLCACQPGRKGSHKCTL